MAPQAEGWLFESQPRQTYVVKTASDSSTAKRPAIGVSVMVLGENHYKRIHVTVDVARQITLMLNGHECRA